MKEQCFSEKEKNLLKRYVSFMTGFEESSLYDDYKEYDENTPKITDEEFGEAFDLIRTLGREGRVC